MKCVRLSTYHLNLAETAAFYLQEEYYLKVIKIPFHIQIKVKSMNQNSHVDDW